MARANTRVPHWGMVIDLNRCIGCETCAVACKVAHDLPDGVWWNRVLTVGGNGLDVVAGSVEDPRAFALPLSCQHCADAPCVKACPTGATFRRPDGIVLVDAEQCIGCRACVQACPYGARTFIGEAPRHAHVDFPLGEPAAPRHVRGVVEKCTFCADRLDAGLEPFCVAVCPARARFFGDLSDPGSLVRRLIAERNAETLHPELGTRPSVYYIAPTKASTHRTGLDRLQPGASDVLRR